jgi:hypothetical protein
MMMVLNDSIMEVLIKIIIEFVAVLVILFFFILTFGLLIGSLVDYIKFKRKDKHTNNKQQTK